MKRLNYKCLVYILSTLALVQAAALQAQQAPTGTRIQNSGAGTAIDSIQISAPQEVLNVRRLLSQGNIEEAKELAEHYVNLVEVSNTSVRTRYYAYNALCAVYTQNHEMVRAEETCTSAISLYSLDWMALNTRGTVRLLTKNFDGAISDYQLALEAAGRDKKALSVINHNIEITRNQMK